MAFGKMLPVLLGRRHQAAGAGCYDATRPLAFMHIPKTSGMALSAAIAQAVRPGFAINGSDRVLFGDFTAFHTIDPTVRHTITSHLPAEHSGFVAGHISYQTLVESRADAQLMTVLREPRSRLLSHWLYWRAHSDEQLVPWGAWADYMRSGQAPLADFLSREDIAAQTDNLAVRMLLWPHRDIPNSHFIDASADRALLDSAAARLRGFDFTDIVENPALADNLWTWLGSSLAYGRLNETRSMPPARRSPLHDELNPTALELLGTRSRLDRKLWIALARERVGGPGAETLGEHTLIRNVARYSALMAA